jgi:ABC-type transporter Mla maintaining outer membrane lipid asymmetry ATPase subunit MlaF
MTEPVKNPAPLAIDMRAVAVGAMRDLSLVVVENVNWSVRAGDYWVVAGLQGAGKTDFVMMTASLIAPLHGNYFFLGEEMPIFEDARLAKRLKLGLVFDGGQLFNHLTVSENIALPSRYHRTASDTDVEAELQRMMELTDLGPWADSTPGAIGRNWCKRVGLARALMLRPEVLVLDNPLAGLDLRHTNWWFNFLDELSKGHPFLDGRPLTLIVTADDLRPWRTHARQFAVLKDKRFAVLGTWEQAAAVSDSLVQELLTAEPPNV